MHAQRLAEVTHLGWFESLGAPGSGLPGAIVAHHISQMTSHCQIDVVVVDRYVLAVKSRGIVIFARDDGIHLEEV